MGPNGVGKTTLLRILIGEETPSAGTVQNSKNLQTGYLPQEAALESGRTLWDECLSVFDELREWQAQLREMDAQMGASHSDADFWKKQPLQARFEQAADKHTK